MDAQQALKIADGARRAAARDRTPGWYPPLFAGLWMVGAVAYGVSLMRCTDSVWRWLLTGVWAVAWVGMIGLAVVMVRRGGVVRRPGARSAAQRWIDCAPDLVAMVVAVVVGFTAGVGWAFVVAGVLGGGTSWYRLARMHR